MSLNVNNVKNLNNARNSVENAQKSIFNDSISQAIKYLNLAVDFLTGDTSSKAKNATKLLNNSMNALSGEMTNKNIKKVMNNLDKADQEIHDREEALKDANRKNMLLANSLLQIASNINTAVLNTFKSVNGSSNIKETSSSPRNPTVYLFVSTGNGDMWNEKYNGTIIKGEEAPQLGQGEHAEWRKKRR